MRIERIEEYQIEAPVKQAIRQLLVDCFQEYPGDRIYFKQLPHFRYLVWEEKQLIGHMAVEYRVINNADQILMVFGIVDLCVNQDFQHNKVASRLIEELEKLGREKSVDFILLLSKKDQLYANNGFLPVDNTCQWLILQSHKTIGVVRRSLANTLMIKPLSEKEWKPGLVDFLGPAF